MIVTINGEEREFVSVANVSDLVAQLGIKSDRVAVELNRELIPRERWTSTQLKNGDKLEIVHFVGGGNAEVSRFQSRKVSRETCLKLRK